jgi:dipeptidyl aminopeptidase/acylaminoacyl peptidase
MRSPRSLRAPSIAIGFAFVTVACSGAPKPPPCAETKPWTPAAIPTPGGAIASATPADAPPRARSPYTIEQLLKVRRAGAPRAIDDERFAYLYDEPGTAQLYAIEDGAPRKLTSYPDRLSSHRVSPDGKTIVFLKDVGGSENDQIHVMPLGGGGDASALTASPKVKHTLPRFDDAGKRIVFTSNARNGKDMDLYVHPWPAPIKEGTAPTIMLSGSFHVADVRGNRALVVEARSNVDQDVWLVDLDKKSKVLLTKHTGDERYEGAHFTKDGRAALVLTDAGREFVGLVAIDLASRVRTTVVAEDHDLGSLAVGRSTVAEDVAAFSVNRDGREELAVVHLDAKRKPVKRLDPEVRGVIGTIDVSPTGKTAYLSAEDSRHPTEIFRVDLVSGAAGRSTHGDHAGIDAAELVDDTIGTFASFDERRVSYFLWARRDPKREGEKLPVVIEIHGGPEAQAQPWFSGVRQYLALSGYAVVAPNVRGSLGYGKSFAHLDDKDKREDSVRDLHELGKHLAGRAELDGRRMALYGGSYGGYMVLAGLTLYPDQWAAGVDVVGIANFVTFLEQTAPYRRALREAEYGSLEKDRALLERISPIGKVDRIKAPLMVIHGTNDPRVPVGEARQIAAALEKRGTPVALMIFDDEGHGLSKLKNRLVAYPAIVEFLDKHVRDRAGAK